MNNVRNGKGLKKLRVRIKCNREKTMTDIMGLLDRSVNE